MAKKTKKKLPPQCQPRLLDEREIEQAAKLAGLGLPVEQIALVLDISKKTFERRVKDQPGVADALEKGRASTSAELRQSAYRKALDGDTTMMIFLLKTREGFREAPREVNLKIGELEKLPHEQVIRLGREAIEYLEAAEDE